MFEFQVCPKCRTAVLDAPGIGQYCPNKDCDVVDNLLGVQPHKIIAFVDPELAALRLDYISAVGQAQTALEERDALRAEVNRLTKANSNLISQAEESAFNATEITDWRIERIAEMGYEAARLRAEVERLRAEGAYIVALLDPLVGGDGAPVQALVRRIAARASASAGAIPSGEAVR